jgi:hypothetical protein
LTGRKKQKPPEGGSWLKTHSMMRFESGGRTYKIRTCDQRIKSPLLYQLS